MGRLARRGRTAGVPSRFIRERVRERVHAQIEESRRQLRDEFAVIEALVRMGQVDAAAHAIEDQRVALQRLGAELGATVAEALAEQPDDARAPREARTPRAHSRCTPRDTCPPPEQGRNE